MPVSCISVTCKTTHITCPFLHCTTLRSASALLAHRLGRLGNQLLQLRVRLVELLGVVLLDVLGLLAGPRFSHHDVHRRDVGGDDDDGGGVVDVGGSRVLRLAQRLDDFLDAAAEGLGLRGCEECQQTRCVVR